MVLKTKSCSLLTVLSKSSPRAAMAATGRGRRGRSGLEIPRAAAGQGTQRLGTLSRW